MFIISSDILSFLKKLPISQGPLVVGVSGGADSLYLTYLLSKWCQKTGKQLLAVTVNHNLRPESLEEAEWVHCQLSKHKIHHDILTWQGTKPTTRVEERAREKRYELLIDFCHKNNASILFLAHHQQDQVETFWTRLAHNSGLDGLCAMRKLTSRDEILITRPLLDTSKDTILKAMKANRLKWIEDPMNEDLSYERVRWRKNQKILDDMGLKASCITKSTQRLQRAKEALDFYTDQFIHDHVEQSPYGFVSIDATTFENQPAEIRVRILAGILRLYQQRDKIISLEGIENIAMNLPKYATLAGCQWVISHKQIFIAPELKQLKQITLVQNQWTTWGNLLLWTNKTCVIQPAAPMPRLKNIPYLVQRTFLKEVKGYKRVFCSEKELEKKVKLDYKDKAPVIIIKLKKRKGNK